MKVIYGTGRQRTENQRWLLFHSHYGFDAFYCQTGIDGAHEKGGVEGDVGRFRRTHLSPMPVVDSRAEINDQIRQWDIDDEDRRINSRLRTVAQDFALERSLPNASRNCSWQSVTTAIDAHLFNPATINTLATGDWVRLGQPLCLFADSGTDKSHLLIGLGTAAAEKGFRVKYTLPHAS